MFWRFVQRTVVCGILPFKIFDNDRVTGDNKTEKSFLKYENETQTGWDRLFMMFSVDEYGAVSPEVNSVYQAGFMGFFFGGCIGGFVQSRAAYLNFMETNEATVFKDHLDAKRKLQDQVTVNFAKGALKWGWRLGLFTSSYVLLTTSISIYRGRSSLLEYVAAGGITGALYKVNLGLRGIVVGAGLGTLLGGVAGGMSLALMKITGTSMEEVRYWQYQWKEDRDRQKQQIFKKRDVEQEGPLLRHHNEKALVAEKKTEPAGVAPASNT